MTICLVLSYKLLRHSLLTYEPSLYSSQIKKITFKTRREATDLYRMAVAPQQGTKAPLN